MSNVLLLGFHLIIQRQVCLYFTTMELYNRCAIKTKQENILNRFIKENITLIWMTRL